MSLSHCRFCAHDNPERARFCNECGSPLHLKPCPRCEAVNEDQAVRCYECGASLTDELPETAEAVAAEPALPAAATIDADLRDSVPPPLHIPESFGERFALDPDGTSRPIDAPPNDADVRGDAPGVTDTGKPGDEEHDSAALFDRERRQKKIAMIVVPVLALAIGLGALYAYRPTAPSAPMVTSANTAVPAVANQDATTAPQPPAETAVTAATIESQPVDAAQAAPTPSTAARPTEREPVSKTAARESKAATNRIVARELGATTPPASTASNADAIATKRIIEREMGRFAQSPQNRRAN